MAADDHAWLVGQMEAIVERSERRTGKLIGDVETRLMDRVGEVDERINGRNARAEGRLSDLERESAYRRGIEDAEKERLARLPSPVMTPDGLIVKPEGGGEPQPARWALTAGKVVGAIAILVSAVASAYATAHGIKP